MSQPWDFSQAVEQHQAAEIEQRRVESEIAQAYKEAGKAKRLYSIALARKMFDLKAAGVAVTACERLALGDPHVAELREAKDIAEGLKETAKVAAWRVNADRRDIGDLLRWSARRDLADASGHGPAPEYETPIGGRS